MYTTSWLEEASSGAYGGDSMTITAFIPLKITKITIDVFPSRDTPAPAFHLIVKDNQGSTAFTSPKYTLEDGTSGTVQRVEVPIKFKETLDGTNTSSTITIQFVVDSYTQTARVNMTDSNKIMNGAVVNTTWAFPCSIEYEYAEGNTFWNLDNYILPTLTNNEYEPFLGWELDSAGIPYNPGVYYISALTETPVLRSMKLNKGDPWERNKYGYPINPAIWRIDHNNAGLPWIHGYAERILAVNLTIGKSDGTLHIKRNKGKIRFGEDYNY